MPILREKLTLYSGRTPLKVMVTPEERAGTARQAAARASMGLSVFLRAMALEAARRREPRPPNGGLYLKRSYWRGSKKV